LEGAEGGVRRREGEARMRLSSRVEVEQLRGHLQELVADALLGLLPGGAAEPVETDVLGAGADEFLDEAQLPDRQVELVVAGEVEDEEVGLHPVELHAPQAPVAAEAVVDVDAEIAFLQVAEGLDGGQVGNASGTALRRARAEDFLVGDQGEAGLAGEEAAGD